MIVPHVASAAQTGASDVPMPLLLSVVVPAHRCAATLVRSLHALRASDLPASTWELIVVDDASGDTGSDTPVGSTAQVATSFADRVIVLPGSPRGPAYARNRGAEMARGRHIAFVDADVCVHHDALRLMCDVLERDDAVGAVFGAYDERPDAPGLVSRYRNLMHRYVHVESAGDAETFWAGCGAVRRDVFRSVGGFDEQRYPRPQIEDIELGHRIRDAGFRIVLEPAIQGTHLKRWTLSLIVIGDVRDRGIPWTELLLEEGQGARASTLNLRATEKVFTALVGLAGVAVLLASVTRDARWLALAAVLLAIVVAGNTRFLRWLGRVGGLRLVLVGIPMRLLHYVLSGISVVGGVWRHLSRRRKRHATGSRRGAIAQSDKRPQVG